MTISHLKAFHYGIFGSLLGRFFAGGACFCRRVALRLMIRSIIGNGHCIRLMQRNAWTHTTGSRDVIVAIIDGGVDIRHPDLG
jgi:subtilisin family serine protease